VAQRPCRGRPCLHPCGARKYAFADAAPPARLERDGVTKLAAQVRAVPADQHRHSQPTSTQKATSSTIRITSGTLMVALSEQVLPACWGHWGVSRDRL